MVLHFYTVEQTGRQIVIFASLALFFDRHSVLPSEKSGSSFKTARLEGDALL